MASLFRVNGGFHDGNIYYISGDGVPGGDSGSQDAAPIGSQYINKLTGLTHRKVTVGTGTDKWNVIEDTDVSTIPEGSVIFVEDSNLGYDTTFLWNTTTNTLSAPRVEAVDNIMSRYMSLTPDADPGTPTNGDIWYNSTDGKFKVRQAGTTLNMLPVGKYSTTIGDGIETDYVITHNLNSRDVLVSLALAASPYSTIIADVEKTTVDTITVSFNVAPTNNEIRVSILAL